MRGARRHHLVVAVLLLWVLAGPLAVAFGPCADMGMMCEGTCALGVVAPVLLASSQILPLVAGIQGHPGDHRLSPFLKVAEPPPKSFLLSA